MRTALSGRTETRMKGRRLRSPWFALPASIVPCGHCSPTPASGCGGAAAPPHGVPAQSQALQVDRVSFAYRTEDGLVLDQISLDVAAGSWVAVVGPSGSGKSTLGHLVLRFWDPTSGEIHIGGHDIRDYALDDLRSMVGVVAQDTHIFADTLRNNLLLARPDATGLELAQALERAQLTALVDGLPRGLDTWVGEQGLRLSGGERQRL